MSARDRVRIEASTAARDGDGLIADPAVRDRLAAIVTALAEGP